MQKQIIQTKDGSHSIYLPQMDEHYHSTHGAIVESEHIFIKNGLLAQSEEKQDVVIFEVGMGTGLNVLTSFIAAQKKGIRIDYHTIEAFPLKWNELDSLNYEELLGIDKKLLKDIHQGNWNQCLELSPNFKLYPYHSDLKTFNHTLAYDLIYFDAFAPEKQEEMWSEEIFSRLFKALKEGGCLVTYCVKGEIRRRLQKVGFKVEKLTGPIGGKREMCRAWK